MRHSKIAANRAVQEGAWPRVQRHTCEQAARRLVHELLPG